MNIKKVPVDYYFSDLVHDPSQRGHRKCYRISVGRLSVRIKKCPVDYYFSNLVHDPRQQGY